MNPDKRRKRAKLKAKENRIKRNAPAPKQQNFIEKSDTGMKILKAFAYFVLATIGISMVAAIAACIL